MFIQAVAVLILSLLPLHFIQPLCMLKGAKGITSCQKECGCLSSWLYQNCLPFCEVGEEATQ